MVNFDDVGRTVKTPEGYGKLIRVKSGCFGKFAVVDLHTGGCFSFAVRKVDVVEVKK